MEVTAAAALEAILFVAEAPVAPERLCEALGVDRAQLDGELEALSARLESAERGLRLERVAGGWRLYTRPELSGYVESFVSRGSINRLSPAAQEVLAVITYRQPVSRNQINEIRGVDSSSSLRSLERMGLVEVTGRIPVPGRPALYGTTELLVEKLGLNSLAELPSLSERVPSPEVMDGLATRTFIS